MSSSTNDDATNPNTSQTSKIKSEYVKLNVGGTLFFTTISTLTKYPNNMLSSMFSGHREMTNVDKEGWVLIDRCGKHFGVILNFLRDGTVPLPSRNREIGELRAEANYYCISELVEQCDQALAGPLSIHDVEPNAFLALPLPLESSIIRSLTKPAIILEVSQYEKIYPTDHVVHFEKLAFDFHEDNIIFIRFVSVVNKWNFYINGQLEKSIEYTHNEVPECEINLLLGRLLKSLIPK